MSTIREVARVHQEALACDICGVLAQGADLQEWTDKPESIAAWVTRACKKCRQRFVNNFRTRPQPTKLDRWKRVELS
jgi:hypothetical protein